MVVSDSVKFDPDACSPGPPNLGVMNEDGNVLSRRDKKESDIHAWNNLNRVLNPTTILGQIHRSDDIWPIVIGKEGARERGGESLVAAFEHPRHHGIGWLDRTMQMQCRQRQTDFP